MTEQQASRPVGSGDPAPDVVVRAEDGQEVALSAFWQQQPTAFIFVRHFG